MDRLAIILGVLATIFLVSAASLSGDDRLIVGFFGLIFALMSLVRMVYSPRFRR